MPLEAVKDEPALLRLAAFALSAVAGLLAFAEGILLVFDGGRAWVTGLLVLVVTVIAGAAAFLAWEGRLVMAGAAGLVGGLTLAFTREATPAVLLLLACVSAFLSDELARRRERRARLPVVLGQAR